jgi:RNA polymerase sigma-70 factor (ECF subfamily)
VSRDTDFSARFLTTRWSLVRAAGGTDPSARVALEELCTLYWYPLYAYARRAGHGADDARDLVQGFFARLLAKNALSELAEEGGHFRSYLLAALRHHLAHERERAQTLKRGGASAFVALEFDGAEARYALEPADPRSPERLFERKWALTVLERALARLAAEQLEKGRGEVFERLRPFLVDDADEPLAAVAAELALSANAARVAVHRLRRRYRELLLAEVAETVDGPAEVEDELRRLFAAVRP